MGKQAIKGLSNVDYEFLLKNTNYSRKEIRQWFKGFMMDNPSGLMSKNKFKNMFLQSLPYSPETKVVVIACVDRLFEAVDLDGAGQIDFREFLVSINSKHKGTTEQKLTIAFKMFDPKRSGTINYKHLNQALWMIFSIYSRHTFQKSTPGHHAQGLFASLNRETTMEISLEEFIKGCQQDPYLRKILLTKP